MNKENYKSHLDQLESESIHILREVAAEGKRPVMLYSIGKDSSVMLHLALKAFSRFKELPFPLMHVDTLWKFKEMISFREEVTKKYNLNMLVHTNPEGIENNVGPFTHGSRVHTDVMKTQGLKQSLNKYKFDLVIGGARRDEEASRSKERVFSFRNQSHAWDPKLQRPELWNIYNSLVNKGESIRVFPLSNWTELDIWLYIKRENIPIVPLYFAKDREVIKHDGIEILHDDNRVPLDGKERVIKKVRFRTLGCYPLTGAIESEADSIDKIIQEVICARASERSGRVIDKDQVGSMEKKKMEGYF